MNIILFGPQGSGKGTMAEFISKKYGLCHISMGDLLRAEVARNTILGNKIAELINAGNLVPDEMTDGLLITKANSKECKKGLILDGYPRRLSQLDFVIKHFKIDAAIELDLSEKDTIKRLSARRQCSKCNTIYNLVSLKPKKSGICDKCGGKLYQREDDKPMQIKKRLALYKEQTEPIKKYFIKAKILHQIDASPSVKEVWNSVDAILSKLKKS